MFNLCRNIRICATPRRPLRRVASYHALIILVTFHSYKRIYAIFVQIFSSTMHSCNLLDVPFIKIFFIVNKGYAYSFKSKRLFYKFILDIFCIHKKINICADLNVRPELNSFDWVFLTVIIRWEYGRSIQQSSNKFTL